MRCSSLNSGMSPNGSFAMCPKIRCTDAKWTKGGRDGSVRLHRHPSYRARYSPTSGSSAFWASTFGSPEILSERFVFDEVDVRTPSLEARLGGVDVLVHLAFIMDPIADENEMRDVNVNGTQNVLRAAGKAGVRKIIYTSSATVYGAHPDNPIPLTEEAPSTGEPRLLLSGPQARSRIRRAGVQG